jgi:hypothetical protein
MRARTLGILALVAALAAMLGWLFHAQYRWEREEIWSGYQGEARDNDFLAAQRLLAATGHPAVCVQGLPERFPPPSDVVILPRRRQPMARADADRAGAWVAAGGLLLAAGSEPEAEVGPTRDALFATFGARMRSAAQGPDSFTFHLGGSPMQVELGGRSRILAAQTARGVPAADPRIVQVRRGKGLAILCADLDCLANDRLEDLDHADFLCAVAAWRPGGRVWIVTREQPPSPWRWLAGHAWPALAALAALGLAGIWAAAPRFGPPAPDPDPARRSFLEHLDACGRYQWQAAGGRPLLAASRGAFRKRLVQVHPGWADLEPGPLARRLAQSSGLSPERIDRALEHPAGTHAAFLESIQTLHHLGRSL